MSAQAIILPTGEVMRTNRELFSRLPAAGLPMMMLIQYLLNAISHGEPERYTERRLMDEWVQHLHLHGLMNERMESLMAEPAFTPAVYALYCAMHELQELMLTAPRDRGGFVTSLVHQGWTGGDVVVMREITQVG